jgi:hypothetical protein
MSRLNHACKDAVSKAQEDASAIGTVAETAASGVANMVSKAVSTLQSEVDSVAETSGRAFKSLGERVHRAAPRSGIIGDISRNVANGITESGEYIANSGLTGASRDLSKLIRANPFPAILIGVGLGWIASRLTKR